MMQLVGCGRVRKTNRVSGLVSIDSTLLQNKIFSFPSKTLSGELIDISVIRKSITKRLSKLNLYKLKPVKWKNLIFDIYYHKSYAYHVESTENEFMCTYSASATSDMKTVGSGIQTSKEKPTTFTFSMPYKINKKDGMYEVIISPPKQAKYLYGEVTTRLFDTTENLAVSAVDIFSRLSSVSVEFKHSEKGEVNSPYDEESILGNFHRILGVFENDQGVVKKGRYHLTKNNHSAFVNITVYPYRNGSKVVYEVSIPYKISSNGNISLNKSTVKEFHHMIKKVIKD